MAHQLQVYSNSKELNLEPLSILSVIFQLTSVTPEIDKVFLQEKNLILLEQKLLNFIDQI